MARLITEWSTDDPQLGASLRDLAAIPEGTPAREEAEAGLHMLQARFAWRRADRLRELDRQQKVRDARRAARTTQRGTCPACRVVVSIRDDGTCRIHTAGIASAQGTDRCDGSRQPPTATLPT